MITSENSYFETSKCYESISFHSWKSVLDGFSLIQHQVKHKSLDWSYFLIITVTEDTLAMVKGPSTSECTSVDQIGQIKPKELLTKSTLCDFSKISREEYMNKDDNQKQPLKIKFSNEMVKGKS